MKETVDVGMILEFLLKSLGVFAVIFLIAVLTPWMAKHVDSWIANYKKSHGGKKSPEDPRLYTVRSIYELPPEESGKSEIPDSENSPDFQKKKSKKAVVAVKKKNKNN
ncbi:MAG: hypothetical protein K2H29_06980 [Oscillospiraceae bacterium]|nr:hypothetical protein [Oscillospiraceae bacterium]